MSESRKIKLFAFRVIDRNNETERCGSAQNLCLEEMKADLQIEPDNQRTVELYWALNWKFIIQKQMRFIY